MTTAKKILVIDDDNNFSFGLVAVLRRAEFQVVAASNGKEGLELIRQEKPHLILCDLMMPPPNGIQLKKEIAGDPVMGKIPFLFLTARTAQADKIAGLESGADDYITKPVDSNELLARIHAVLRRDQASHERGMLEEAVNTERLYNENETLKHNAKLDPLTGVMNRRALDTLYIKLYRFVVMIDLDNFKQINEEHGRDFGDQLLIEFAGLSKRVLRQDDIIIRWGSDEFLLVLDGLTKNYDGYQDVEKILARLQGQYTNAHPELGLSFSYGIAQMQESFDTALARADHKMFEMKLKNKPDETALASEEENLPASTEIKPPQPKDGEYYRRQLNISKYRQ